MAIRHIPDGGDFQFDSDFGFSHSGKGPSGPRNHPAQLERDEVGDGTYLGQPRRPLGDAPTLRQLDEEPKLRPLDDEPTRRPLGDDDGSKYARGGRAHFADGGSEGGPPTGRTTQSFGDAFRTHRAAGDTEFSWNGRRYTTQMKGEATRPMPRPPIPDEPTRTISTKPQEYEPDHWKKPEEHTQSSGDFTDEFPEPPVPPRNPPSLRQAQQDRVRAAAHDDDSDDSGGKSVPAEAPPGLMNRGGHAHGFSGDDWQKYEEFGKARRVHKAMGGPLQPPAPVGPPVDPRGVPTAPGPSPGGGLLKNASITMPAQDAKNLVSGAVKIGAAGMKAAQQAPMAALARRRPPPPQPMGGIPPAAAGGMASAPPMMTPPAGMKRGGHNRVSAPDED